MALVADLVYDDAPWTERTGSVLRVHAKISHTVAESLGVPSLRRHLLFAQNLGTMPVGLAAVETFGQSEALTTR